MRARENPFRTERVLTARYRLLDETWEGLLARLAKLNHRAAIVGPDGSGKTTLLEDLEPRLADHGFTARSLRLSDQRRSFPAGFLNRFLAELGGDDVILFDGADLMGRFAWARFKRRTRKARGLIITSHRPGLLPTLIECRTTPRLLEDIVAQLLADRPRPEPGSTRRLFRKHNGDLRAALRELYDIHAARPGP